MRKSLPLKQILQLCIDENLIVKRILWLSESYVNHTVINPGKYHYMLIGNHDAPDKANLNGTGITCSNNQKLLGVLIDRKLSFDVHIISLCKKEGQKFSALTRISSYLALDEVLLLINSVIKSVLLLPSSMDVLVAFFE